MTPSVGLTNSLSREDARRVLDVLYAVLNGDAYPINALTQPHIESIIEKIDADLQTGWTGHAYTEWMDGVGP